MTTADLQKKVSEILGVSVSEKELAFEIFISKIRDLLTDEVTLKVQRVGFFQLKKNIDKTAADSLLFIPLSEELYRESKNLFLTIPIPVQQNTEDEIVSDVFSIGVGKPILPLSESENQNTETSYAILRKSIEERVVEILSEADQLPNFNIWEDYYKSVRYVEHEDEKDKLSELTADIDFKEEFMAEDLTKNLLELSSELDIQENEEKNDKPSEVSLYDLLGDYQAENLVEEQRLIGDYENEINNSQVDDDELEKSLLNVIENVEESTDEPDISIIQNDEIENEEKEIESEIKEVGHGFDEVESIVDDLLKNYETEENIPKEDTTPKDNDAFEEVIEEKNSAGKEDTKETEPPVSEIESIIGDLSGSFDDDFIEDEKEDSNSVEESTETIEDLLEIEVPTQSKEILFEIKRESMLDEVDLEAAKENDEVEPVYFLGLKNKDYEPVEWDWGDELKEEFGVEFLKEEKERIESEKKEERDDEEPDNLEQIFRRAKPKVTKHLDDFDNNPDENKKEPFEQHQVLEFSGQPTRYKFIEDDSAPKTGINDDIFDQLQEASEENMKSNDKGFSFGKVFLIILSSFIVVAALIIYFLAGNKGSQQTNIESKNGIENYSLDNDAVQNQVDTSLVASDDYNDFPRVPTAPVQGTQSNNTPVQQNIQNQQLSAQQGNNKKTNLENDLYRKLETDTRVGKTIYFDGKTYNYQVSSWRNKAKAEQEVKRLRGLGFDAFLTEAFLPEKGGTWYRVRIGNYKTREEAEQNSIKQNI